MKSIPLALTWEFWRQAGVALFVTVALLVGLMALIYGWLRLDELTIRHDATLAGLHMSLFILVIAGLTSVICRSTAAPQYRFALPVSTCTSLLVPAINGTIAIVICHLSVAVTVNWLFHAEWNLAKPTIIAIGMLWACQAVGWMVRSSNLRGAIVAGVSTVLGTGVFYLHFNFPHVDSPDQLIRAWRTIRPLDVALAIAIPVAACTFSFVALTLARRGQVFSSSAMGRWLLATLEVGFGTETRSTTPMAAELWSDWNLRGRVMPAMPILIATIICGFFLSGRFAWESARTAIVIFSWLQVMLGSILGLYIGHVGEQFDFHEFTATRPLSDVQLADVKLCNTLKSVCWTWIMWAIGVAVAVVCLTLVGQGPKSWSDIVPPQSPGLLPLLYVVLIPLCSWTLTSLSVSIVILRPWLVKTVFGILALLPFVPYAVLFLTPLAENKVIAASQWGWICLTIGGTVTLYVTAFRLRLITAKRIAIVGVSYFLFCAAGLSVVSFLTPVENSLPLAIGFVLSNCILPFVCIAAVPLAIWWNRHR